MSNITIEERLEKMKEALEKVQGPSKPSRVTYCTECDEYKTGWGNLGCDFMNEESDIDHYKHHVVADYEETDMLGYIKALEWVMEKQDNDE